jgi:hypothetical protein
MAAGTKVKSLWEDVPAENQWEDVPVEDQGKDVPVLNAKPSLLDLIGKYSKWGANQVVEAGKGFVKSGIQHALNAGEWARENPLIGPGLNVLSPDVINPVNPEVAKRVAAAGGPRIKPGSGSPVFTQQGQKAVGLTPEGTAQKIGGGVESAAEFFVPGGATTKASKALEIIPKSGSLITRLLNLATRAGLEAGSASGVTALQGGEGTGTAAMIGAATPLVGAAAQPIIERAPGAIVDYAIRPLAKQFRFGKQPGKAIADLGWKKGTALTNTGLLKNAENALNEEVQGTKAILRQPENQIFGSPRLPNGTIPLGPIPPSADVSQAVVSEHPGFFGELIRPNIPGKVGEQLEQAKNAQLIEDINRRALSGPKVLNPEDYLDPTKRALLEATEDTGIAPTNLKESLEDLQSWITTNPVTKLPRGPQSLEQGMELSRRLGKNTIWSGAPHEKPLNAVKSQTYGMIRGDIKEALPEIAPRLEKESSLLEAVKAMERKESQPWYNKMARFSDLGILGAGAGVGYATGDEKKGVGLAAGLKLLQTTPGATTAAQIIRSTPTLSRLLRDIALSRMAARDNTIVP